MIKTLAKKRPHPGLKCSLTVTAPTTTSGCSQTCNLTEVNHKEHSLQIPSPEQSAMPILNEKLKSSVSEKMVICSSVSVSDASVPRVHSSCSDNSSSLVASTLKLNSMANVSQDCNSSETIVSITNVNESQIFTRGTSISPISNLKKVPVPAPNAEILQINDQNEINVSIPVVDASKMGCSNEGFLSVSDASNPHIHSSNELRGSKCNANDSQICNLNEAISSTSDAEGSQICNVEQTTQASRDGTDTQNSDARETIAFSAGVNDSNSCNLKENTPSTSNANGSPFSKKGLIPASVVKKIMSGEGFLLRKFPSQETSVSTCKERPNCTNKVALKVCPISRPKPVEAEPKKNGISCTSTLERNVIPILKPKPVEEEAKKDEIASTSSLAKNICAPSRPEPAEEEPKVLVQTLPIVNLSIGSVGHFSTDIKLKSVKSVNKAVKSIGSSVGIANYSAATNVPEHVMPEKRIRKKKVVFDLEEPQPCSPNKRMCHGLNFQIQKGRGIKLKDIDCIPHNLAEASPSMLRILHYVLFGTYGQDRTDNSRSRTIRNILHFSGFSFEEDSEEFKRKHVCLTRIPLPVLMEIQNAILGTSVGMRSEVVENLLSFFMAPEKTTSEMTSEHHESGVEPSNTDLDRLKEHILKGPAPIVLLERLEGSYIDEMARKVGSAFGRSKASRIARAKYCKPSFIFDGPGITLKKIKKVRRKVFRAREDVVSLVHFILYGRTEALHEMRRNILEFNGFSELQKEFAETEPIILSCLTYTELQQICDTLDICATDKSKKRRVNKIVKFLYSPQQPPTLRSRLEHRKKKMLRRKAKSDLVNNSALSKSTPLKSRKESGTSESIPLKSRKESGTSESTSLKSRKESGTSESTPLKSRKESGTSESKPEESASKVQDSPKSEGETAGSKPKASVESQDLVNVEESTSKATSSESANENAETPSENLPKLADFEKIRQNVECASPKDLLELNDLLLLNPSDECDIHQNVLQSTQFSFPENSLEFRARKMVLHYWPLESMRKVAKLLDIRNYEKISVKEELSTSILKFLTNMVQESPEEKGEHGEKSNTVYIHRIPSNSLKSSKLYTNIQPVCFLPTEEELEQFISRVVTSGLWSCKDEDLIELVFKQYPLINLDEVKVKLIKGKAKEILFRTREKAYNSLAKKETPWYSKTEDDTDEYIDIMT